ncbi:MAG: hypothetical protein MRERV_27c029 [Mycoplasmataceae bacterium RV_VA103A]|nr:MAG: hypothetical protein MRERV_27c029 [Mycoplasmataceae bacterium RV_VA103A]
MVTTNKNIIPIESKKVQVVEIRYLENQETSKSEKFLGSVLSPAYCMPNGGKNNGVSLGAKIETGVDLVSIKAGPVETKLKPNVDTGASAGTDGVEVKAAGFGISVGRKTGISTPLGEVAINTDDCVIQ